MASTRASDRQEGVQRAASLVTVSRAVLVLGVVVAVLAAVAAAVGLLTTGGPGPHAVTSLRGQATDLYGTGLYRYDSWLVGVGNRGTDAVTLLLEVPALVVGLVLHARRSLQGTIVLVGVLGWMLYYDASLATATAYTRLFPLHVALFAASLVALPLALGSIDAAGFAASFPNRPSRRVLVGYLAALAAVLTLAWAPEMISDAVGGALPKRLGAYTTPVTWALDLGVVVPAVAVTAVLLHRRSVVGPLAATAMLALNVALGVALLGQGAAQLLAGVPMTAGEKVGAIASFAVMTAVAGLLLAQVLTGLSPAHDRQLR